MNITWVSFLHVCEMFRLGFRAANLSVSVDVPAAAAPVLLPLPLLRGHLHLPQVDLLPPGGDVADSHNQTLGKKRGVRLGETAGGALSRAQVRERHGAEMAAGVTGDDRAIRLVRGVVSEPPAPPRTCSLGGAS